MVRAAKLDLQDAAGCLWDAVVLGAGPAGSLAARQLALRGARVLLVDRACFPRWKICGCCLNARTLAALASVGLGELGRVLDNNPVQAIRLAAHGRQANVRLPVGMAISRTAFDTYLVQMAQDAGSHFLPNTYARVEMARNQVRNVTLHSDGKQTLAAAHVVLVATGVASGTIASDVGVRQLVRTGARVGAGLVVDEAPDAYHPGAIFMACGNGGYVGLVRLEDGRLNVAAALDTRLVKEAGGLGEAAVGLLRESGLPAVPQLAALAWRGTPRLTHTIDPPAAERLFFLGDAAGYVEPFTGEGIGWALESAVAVAPLAYEACQRWRSSLVQHWSRLHREKIAQRWWLCRGTAELLRRPALVGAAVMLLARAPGLASPVVRYLNARDAL